MEDNWPFTANTSTQNFKTDSRRTSNAELWRMENKLYWNHKQGVENITLFFMKG